MDNEIEKSLPRGVALSWGLVKPSQRGPKREMSLKQIVDTAIAIADKDGLAAVSMNRVAASLGFTTMSLYRYVPSKDDLMLLMQDAVSEIQIPPKEAAMNWRDDLRTFVQIIARIFQNHPWLCDVPITGIPITPNNLRIADWALRIMGELPLTPQEKMSIVMQLTSYARVNLLFEREIDHSVHSGASSGPLHEADFHQVLDQLVTSERFPHLQPVVKAGAYSAQDDDKGENSFGFDFDFGLERILDGIEHYVHLKN